MRRFVSLIIGVMISLSVYASVDFSFADVAEKVMPAVVNISATRVVRMNMQDPFFEFFKGTPFEDMFRTPMQSEQKSLGSGFIFTSDGYIITNNHVIEGAEEIIVKVGEDEYSGDDVEIVGADPETDVAVLKIHTKKKLPTIPIGDSDKLRVGEWVMAVGNPFGLSHTVTVGVVSAKGRSGMNGPIYQDFIQTDASINPGNSGGPLVNTKGEVIGINTMILSPSGGNIGIGFAIPINMAMDVVQQLIEEGSISRGYLGVYLQAMDKDLRERLKVKEGGVGVLVTKVEEDSPADKGGMKEGDVIVKYDGKKVKDIKSLQLLVARTHPGTTVSVVVVRDGKEKKLKIKIGEKPTSMAVAGKDNWLGLVVADVNSPEAKKFNIKGDQKGVVIIDIDRDSPSARTMLSPGDIIIGIEGYHIKNMKDFMKAKKGLKDRKKPILIKAKDGRTGFLKYVVVKPEKR